MGENNETKLLKAFELMEEAEKVTLDEDFGLSLDEINEMVEYFNEDYDGLLTGIKSIDRMLGKGIYPKSLTTFLAPPGIGKTAAMIAFLCQFLRQGKDCVFISLEMSEKELMKRVYSNLLDIDIHLLDSIDPTVIQDRYNSIKEGLGKLTVKEYPSYSASALNIESFLEKYEQKTGIDKPIVFVDYLGIMNSARLKSSNVNSYEYIKSITAELRGVAQERDLQIFTAGQLNRNAVGNLEAGQETVADSAGISAFSDAMIFLLQTKTMKEEGKILMNFEKNRYSGKTYSFEIGFDYSHMRFEDLSEPVVQRDEHGLEIPQSSFKL
jgi:replicative DNA helicase